MPNCGAPSHQLPLEPPPPKEPPPGEKLSSDELLEELPLEEPPLEEPLPEELLDQLFQSEFVEEALALVRPELFPVRENQPATIARMKKIITKAMM